MRTTSAPRSPRIIAACGPGPIPASSTTRNPFSGPDMMYRPFVHSDDLARAEHPTNGIFAGRGNPPRPAHLAHQRRLGHAPGDLG
ncbi:alpha-methylacyl-CoA racemase domain protein [Mycobacterium ulcerans str. Harvey]|uniref:Alpha-methylacyl-CoA racemase domain protein n=1 Tax=Mycobacterium ulcerans str. Harvey TaxID=1299332 RepID=A0ABN0R489_MYCUL|nr:alpha-methylacyl-CoA racemase domain protein [Mycobacterium ulcerans str. Harvey]